MTKKQREYEIARKQNADKWADFMEKGGKMTTEKIEQMREDNKKLMKMAREATKEWLEEKEKH